MEMARDSWRRCWTARESSQPARLSGNSARGRARWGAGMGVAARFGSLPVIRIRPRLHLRHPHVRSTEPRHRDRDAARPADHASFGCFRRAANRRPTGAREFGAPADRCNPRLYHLTTCSRRLRRSTTPPARPGGSKGCPTGILRRVIGSRVATKARLPRFDGPKPSYNVNPAHVPVRGLRPGKTPLPGDAEDVYRGAVPNDSTNPTAWFGKSDAGQIYRDSIDKAGGAHFSGIDGVGDGVRNLTTYARGRLGGG